MTHPLHSLLAQSASNIANAIAAGDVSAVELVEAALAGIAARNPAINCVTDLTADRARDEATAVDDRRRRGQPLGPLAGVPYAVKNLFDLAGVSTRAGSKINRDNPPARRDAFAVRALQRAGGVCLGALGMGEYAYDFSGENAHDGDCRNPHDLTRMAGGSSSGPAAAVASGMVPVALGSDTNGSIRVPASFCGLFGLKPTFGRLSRAGTFPFCASLDHIGPLARCVPDLALFYDAMLGHDPDDPAQSNQPATPLSNHIHQGSDGLRIAVADGYFRRQGLAEAFAAVDHVAAALNVSRTVTIPQAARARAAAYVITAAESAALHLARLRTRAGDFDPAVRDRLLAGSMIPAPWLVQAQRFRRWYQDQLADLFTDLDLIIAPATPCHALPLGQQIIVLDGQTLPARPSLGIFTQPISYAGLPVVTVPVWLKNANLPIGVQLIGAPWREQQVLRVAYQLEHDQHCRSVIAQQSIERDDHARH